LGSSMFFGDKLYVVDPASNQVVVMDSSGGVNRRVDIPGGSNAELQQQDGRLVIDSQNSDKALLIDPGTNVTEIAKYHPPLPSDSAPPRPGTQAQSQSQPQKSGNGRPNHSGPHDRPAPPQHRPGGQQHGGSRLPPNDDPANLPNPGNVNTGSHPVPAYPIRGGVPMNPLTGGFPGPW
ncbi:MAG TPA: hypothetical protein VHU91_00205, partial [Mycobacteriales bacterium]|nr:hypothetical protein [Mycobacteriales bacterium]